MKLLTIKQAAERKGVTPAAIYLAVHQGRIPHAKVLGRIALKEKDVDAYTPIPFNERKGAKLPGRPRKPAATAGV